MAAGLSQAINQQITPCWKIQAGARDAANMSVAVNIRLNPDGSLERCAPKGRGYGAAWPRPVISGRSPKVRNARCGTRPVCR
jgi:hypothetical protein